MATSFREEHRQALDWLNDLAEGNARFFGVEIGAVSIAGSPAAPLFKLRAQPNDWHSEFSAAAKATAQTSGRGPFYLQFWARFLERVHAERPGWTSAHKPGSANWMALPCPFKGGSFYSVAFTTRGKMRFELYIDGPTPEAVDSLYHFLADRKDAIEASYGAGLTWEPLPTKRASRIATYLDGDVADSAAHESYVTWFLEEGSKLREALAGPAVEWALIT
jgi:hypothetical protein